MTDWPIEIDGREFSPIPESWIERGHDDGHGIPRIYAVSAAVCGRQILHVRYLSTQSPKALRVTMRGADGPNGGTVPEMLLTRRTWPRSITPDGAGPSGAARTVEIEHLRELWAGEIEDIPGPDELVADGGRVVDPTRGLAAGGNDADE